MPGEVLLVGQRYFEPLVSPSSMSHPGKADPGKSLKYRAGAG
jgi:hypothetical protein